MTILRDINNRRRADVFALHVIVRRYHRRPLGATIPYELHINVVPLYESPIHEPIIMEVKLIGVIPSFSSFAFWSNISDAYVGI